MWKRNPHLVVSSRRCRCKPAQRRHVSQHYRHQPNKSVKISDWLRRLLSIVSVSVFAVFQWKQEKDEVRCHRLFDSPIIKVVQAIPVERRGLDEFGTTDVTGESQFDETIVKELRNAAKDRILHWGDNDLGNIKDEEWVASETTDKMLNLDHHHTNTMSSTGTAFAATRRALSSEEKTSNYDTLNKDNSSNIVNDVVKSQQSESVMQATANSSAYTNGNLAFVASPTTNPGESVQPISIEREKEQVKPRSGFLGTPSTGLQHHAVHGGHQYYHATSNKKGPPDGFILAARVYNDPNDHLAYFDTDYSQLRDESASTFTPEETHHKKPRPVVLPYWDCGVSGSTTSPLLIHRGYFRHSLSHTAWRGRTGARKTNSTETHGEIDFFEDSYSEATSPQESFFVGSKEPRHAALAVALQPLRIELSSGEGRDFKAGEVILLDDVHNPGHRIMGQRHTVPLSVPSSDTNSNAEDASGNDTVTEGLPLVTTTDEVAILFLTLPHPYPHGVDGRKYVSILEQQPQFRSRTRKADRPCRTDNDVRTISTDDRIEDKKERLYEFEEAAYISYQPRQKQYLVFRRSVLALIGLSLSSLLAEFLAKTTPLWLAVGVGGTCLVALGTFGVVAVGEYVHELLLDWYWSRKEGNGDRGLLV
jgi:hypothetical protein